MESMRWSNVLLQEYVDDSDISKYVKRFAFFLMFEVIITP